MGQFSEFHLTLIATLSITAIMSYGGMYVLHPVPKKKIRKKLKKNVQYVQYRIFQST